MLGLVPVFLSSTTTSKGPSLTLYCLCNHDGLGPCRRTEKWKLNWLLFSGLLVQGWAWTYQDLGHETTDVQGGSYIAPGVLMGQLYAR